MSVLLSLLALVTARLEVAFAAFEHAAQSQSTNEHSLVTEIAVGIASGTLGVVVTLGAALWRTRRQNKGAARLLLADLRDVHRRMQFVYGEGELGVREGEDHPYDLQSLRDLKLPHWEGAAGVLGASLRKKRWIEVLDAVDVVEDRAEGIESNEIDDDFARSELGRDLTTVQDAILVLSKISAWDAPKEEVLESRSIFGLEVLLSEEDLEFREALRFPSRVRFHATRPFTWRKRRRIERELAAEFEHDQP